MNPLETRVMMMMMLSVQTCLNKKACTHSTQRAGMGVFSADQSLALADNRCVHTSDTAPHVAKTHACLSKPAAADKEAPELVTLATEQ
jgi:hypothetical protein